MPRAEVAYFEDGLYCPSKWDHFLSNFDTAKPSQIIGFKRPNLLGLPSVAERLQSCLGNLKLIVVLRQPADRAISAYFHYMATGLLPCLPPEVGFEKLFNGELTDWPRAAEVLQFGLYGHHLQNYENLFGRNNIFVFKTSALSESESKLSEIFHFLNVDPTFRPTDHKIAQRRPMAAPYSLTRIRIRKLLQSPATEWINGSSYFQVRAGRFWSTYMKLVRYFDKKVLAS